MEIVIVPNIDEIVVKENGHIFEVEFNNVKIEYVINGNNTLDEKCWDDMKKCIQQAIALSSKPWQLRWLLNGIKNNKGEQLGTTNVYDITTGKMYK